MNRYIVGINENGLGETILTGSLEKLIETEETLTGRTKWTVLSMPNLDGVKTIAKQVEINTLAKNAVIESNIQAVKQKADDYIINIYGAIVSAGIGMVDNTMNKPLALSVKTDFLIPVSNHVTEVCTAIVTGQPYDFNLEQFTTEITEAQIREEAGL